MAQPIQIAVINTIWEWSIVSGKNQGRGIVNLRINENLWRFGTQTCFLHQIFALIILKFGPYFIKSAPSNDNHVSAHHSVPTCSALWDTFSALQPLHLQAIIILFLYITFPVSISTSSDFNGLLITGLYSSSSFDSQLNPAMSFHLGSISPGVPSYTAQGSNQMCSIVHQHMGIMPMKSSEFYWVAPPEGSGCVNFL